MRLTRMGDRYVAVSTYEERLIAKQAGFRWDPTRKQWYTTDVTTAGKLAKYADDNVREEVQAAAHARIAALNASKAGAADIAVPAPAGLEYLPFQKAGVAYILPRQSVLLADDMGLGKTVQAIGVINADATIRRVVIIVPASLRLNWERELRKWLTRQLSIGIATGTEWPETDIVILSYDVAAKHTARLRAEPWDLAVLDEGHKVKTQDAQRTVATVGREARKKKGIEADAGIPARRKLVLTGTPIVNRPVEAYPFLHWLRPDLFKSFFSYAKRYCGAHDSGWGWDFSGASHLDELQEKLRVHVMVRRRKADVLKELPAKRRQVLVIPANGAQGAVDEENRVWRDHEETIAHLREQVELAKASEDETDYQAAVAKLVEAQQVAFGAMSSVRQATALAKVPAVIQLVIDALENDDDKKVIVFAWHHSVVEALRNGLANYCPVTLTGETSMVQRQLAVDQFQQDPACRVFIGSITAAGVGLTLTASDHEVFAEIDWVPANMNQAEDRAHRIGQTNSVLVQHVVLDGSLDSRMVQELISKQEVIDKALDRAAPPLPEPTPAASATETTSRGRVAKLAEQLTADQQRLVHDAIRRIAGLCDGARALDGHGFNKMDAHIGMELARRATLTPKQAALGFFIVRKYRRQLGEPYVTAFADITKG